LNEIFQSNSGHSSDEINQSWYLENYDGISNVIGHKRGVGQTGRVDQNGIDCSFKGKEILKGISNPMGIYLLI
jgi:hypothetical protein